MRTIQKTVTYSVSIKEIGRPVSFTRKGDIPEIPSDDDWTKGED